MNLLTLLILTVCITGSHGTLKRLRRASYVENYRLNHFTLEKWFLDHPLGELGTVEKRQAALKKSE